MTVLQESGGLLFPGTALFSDDGAYRYNLTRRWSDEPLVVWVMLNPSTADAFELDPTVRRCVNFTRAWGFGGIRVVNMFALRSTDPKALRHIDDPRGDELNVATIIDAIRDDAAFVVGAWGAAPEVPESMVSFITLTCRELRKQPLRCLGRTANGSPRHPLYVRGDTPLEDFE